MSRSVQLTAYKYGMQLAARDAGYASLDVFTKQAAAIPGALIGAGLGIGLGAGVGAAADDQDRWRGAAVGAGLGGLAGAGIGGVAGHLMKGTGKAVASAAPKVEQAAAKTEQAVAKTAPAAKAPPKTEGVSAHGRKPAPIPNGGVSPQVPDHSGVIGYLGAPSLAPPNLSPSLKAPGAASAAPMDASRYQGEARAMAQSHFNPPDSSAIRKMNKTQMGAPSVPTAASPGGSEPGVHESGIRMIGGGKGHNLSTPRRSPTPQSAFHTGMAFDPMTGQPVVTPLRG